MADAAYDAEHAVRAGEEAVRGAGCSAPVDQADRMKYFVFGITSEDFWGMHDDDGVVAVRSALADSLGPMGERSRIHLKYPGIFATRVAAF